MSDKKLVKLGTISIVWEKRDEVSIAFMTNKILGYILVFNENDCRMKGIALCGQCRVILSPLPRMDL